MRRLGIVAATLAALTLAASALADPPFDIEVSWTLAPTGQPADGVRIYLNDCDVTGPTGPELFNTNPTGTPGAGTPSPITLADALPDFGTFTLCARPFNAFGEQLDPGPVATVTISGDEPARLEALDIRVVCRDSAGIEVPCDSTGVTISIIIE